MDYTFYFFKAAFKYFVKRKHALFTTQQQIINGPAPKIETRISILIG